MTSYDSQNKNIVGRSEGFFTDLLNRFRLVGRLMMDPRVNPFLKILPIGTLIYFISPVDLMPINPIDDAFIVWAGTTLFVQLCPPEVIEEHLKSLRQMIKGQGSAAGFGAAEGDVIDGVYREVRPRD